MYEKKIMTVVIGLGGRCFRPFCMLFGTVDDWVKYFTLRYKPFSETHHIAFGFFLNLTKLF